jgi:hypothetical protein
LESEKISHPPKIGEIWIYKDKNKAEHMVQIDYLDDDIIWFSYLESSDADDWSGLEYFIWAARKYD